MYKLLSACLPVCLLGWLARPSLVRWVARRGRYQKVVAWCARLVVGTRAHDPFEPNSSSTVPSYLDICLFNLHFTVLACELSLCARTCNELVIIQATTTTLIVQHLWLACVVATNSAHLLPNADAVHQKRQSLFAPRRGRLETSQLDGGYVHTVLRIRFASSQVST